MGIRMKSRKMQIMRFGMLTALIMAILLMDSLWHPARGADRNRSLIFVIDSSEKMAPHLVDVKALIFTFADRAKRGDFLSIISFSETPQIASVKRISSKHDKQSIEFWLDAISPSGEQGDVALGVARAMESLEQLSRKGDRNLKGIVVISSSKSPDPRQASEVLDTALKRLSSQVSKKEWYIQYCYLDGIYDRQVEAFVSDNQGFSYDIDALRIEDGTETMEELYKIVSSPEGLCPAGLRDIKGIILGRGATDEEWSPLKARENVSEKADLRVATNSRAILEMTGFGKIGLDSDADMTFIAAKKELLTGQGLFEITLKEGSIWLFFGKKRKGILKLRTADGVVELSAQAGSAEYYPDNRRLILTSFAESFSVKTIGKGSKTINLGTNESIRLEAGQIFEEVEAAAARSIEKWKPWEQALVKNVPLLTLDFAVPEVKFLDEAVTIGPIKSGAVESRDLPIEISGVNDLSQLKMQADLSLALPDGLAVSTGISKGKESNTNVLGLKVDGSGGFKTRRRDTYPGLLSIVPAADSQIRFEKVSIPLTILTRGPLLSGTVLIIIMGLILFGAIVIGAMYMFGSTATARPKPHSVIGRLITVNDPTGGRIGTINLEEVGTRSSRLSLVIGRDRAVDVRLKHASVSREHCTMEAHLIGGRLETFIEPMGLGKIEVDGETISSRTCLTDGAKIKIGEFIYQFEDSQLYKKAEVMRRNGRRISGILDAAGMDAEGFRLSPMDAVSPGERARIRYSDIRHAIFYRRVADILSGKERRMARTDMMKKVELMFRKGDIITGYVQREYVEGRRKYVELIPLDPNSEIDYTLVDYSFVVEKKTL